MIGNIPFMIFCVILATSLFVSIAGIYHVKT